MNPPGTIPATILSVQVPVLSKKNVVTSEASNSILVVIRFYYGQRIYGVVHQQSALTPKQRRTVSTPDMDNNLNRSRAPKTFLFSN